MQKNNFLQKSPNRRICPMCGERTYSRDGIHPQCAVEQADAPRKERLKAEAKERKENPPDKASNPLALSPWHKRCPVCREAMHIRKMKCDCGHQFTSSK